MPGPYCEANLTHTDRNSHPAGYRVMDGKSPAGTPACTACAKRAERYGANIYHIPVKERS